MEIRRGVTALLNGVVFLGSLYLGTTTGAGSWQDAIVEGIVTGGLLIAGLTFLNVVVLYHRGDKAAAYVINPALILAGLWTLLMNSFLAGYSSGRDQAIWLGMAAIAVAVVNLIPPSLYNGSD